MSSGSRQKTIQDLDPVSEKISYSYLFDNIPESKWFMEQGFLPLTSGLFVSKNGFKGRTIVTWAGDMMNVSSFIDIDDKITTQGCDGDLSHPCNLTVAPQIFDIYFGDSLSPWPDGPCNLSIYINHEYILYWIYGGLVGNNIGAAKMYLDAKRKTIQNVYKMKNSKEWLSEDKFKELYRVSHLDEFVPDTYESAIEKWCPWAVRS